MNQEKIGNLIKQIRKENQLTQQQFASKYGVTYQAVSKWENGKNIPDIALLRQMSKDFHIDIQDILDGEMTTKKKKKYKYVWIVIVVFCFLFVGGFCY